MDYSDSKISVENYENTENTQAPFRLYFYQKQTDTMNKRIWFITGISSGLGKALAETLIQSDEFVIGTFRKDSEVENFNTVHQDKARGVLLDVTDMENIDAMIQEVVSEFGQIDVLVNNAGIGYSGAVEEASLGDVRKVFEANFFGTLKMTQAVLPHMRSKKNGHIIQISSHAGVKAFAGFGIYNASKFALEGFSEALAQEVKPLGIGLTLVEPGPFRTNFAGRSLMRAKKQIEDYQDTAGNFRAKLDGVHNKQEGDPIKAAKIILQHINSGSDTLRLPLGTIPIKTIGMKIESLQSDLESNKDLAIKAVY